ncbi:thioredoxin family protein [Sphingobacterium bovistauri]|uniref:Thioredoxin family protein n=1 Tax=Sphingobacterium bovistauri TaxID=2781959 RepID=A0ABS7Z8M5_9SPHI|nr:thioredoxin family protein [Sphingobacterium bovistauri]MCA5005877.1 thioredoxin family protein [Sphingobacterium bovistauri]
MRKIILGLLLIVNSIVSVHSQSMYGDEVKVDVKVKYVHSFEEALAKAKATNKLVFFNCFADWALPCHGMNKKVFSDQEFATWLDNNFVTFITDVTKGPGITLAEKYKIQTQPHYLILDANGEVIHRIVGGSEIPVFKERVAQALSPKTSLIGLKAQYAKGKRDVAFLKLYYTTLRYAEENKEARLILDQVFEKLKPKSWSKKENWDIFTAQTRSFDDLYFTYLTNNKDKFIKENGQEVVYKLISDMFTKSFFKLSLSSQEYNEQKMLEMYLLMQKLDINKEDKAYVFYNFAKFRSQGNMEGMVNILNAHGSSWDPNVLRVTDLSLSEFKDLSNKDEKILIEYWQKRADSFNGTTKNHYLTAIKNLSVKTGIVFSELSFQAALDKAAAENKLVFLDCYTTWCGPCKWLDANTFKEKAVGDYFNKNFVSIKIDMEKGEGIELMKKYEVTAFPTLFLLDPKGNVVKKMMGAMDGTRLLNQVKN